MRNGCDSICRFCNKEYTHRINGARTVCFYCTTKIFKLRRKKRAIVYKGGRCQHCGYDRCLRALNFHHRKPSEKSFGLSRVYTWAWDRLQPELDKCDLLCANCHMEVEEAISQQMTKSVVGDKIQDFERRFPMPAEVDKNPTIDPIDYNFSAPSNDDGGLSDHSDEVEGEVVGMGRANVVMKVTGTEDQEFTKHKSPRASKIWGNGSL